MYSEDVEQACDNCIREDKANTSNIKQIGSSVNDLQL